MENVQVQPVIDGTVTNGLTAYQNLTMHFAFLYGALTDSNGEQNAEEVQDLVTRGFLSFNDGKHKLTLAGVKEYTDYYQKLAASYDLDEDSKINYFSCAFAERTADGYDGAPIMASNLNALNYVKLLLTAGHLSISDKTSAYDYAVLDFIDEYTGESHDLFPGDTVVLTGEGYIVHKFSE